MGFRRTPTVSYPYIQENNTVNGTLTRPSVRAVMPCHPDASLFLATSAESLRAAILRQTSGSGKHAPNGLIQTWLGEKLPPGGAKCPVPFSWYRGKTVVEA